MMSLRNQLDNLAAKPEKAEASFRFRYGNGEWNYTNYPGMGVRSLLAVGYKWVAVPSTSDPGTIILWTKND